jgi:myosin heavy subunit
MSRYISNLLSMLEVTEVADPRSSRRKPTVAAVFNEQLQSLIRTMSRCAPFFVRCIKPNTVKMPSEFDYKIVLEQLQYSGMLETIRIRKAGCV